MSREAFTKLLEDWQSGSSSAMEAITPLVYDELRKIAENRMRDERAAHTLQATALVNEAFIKLANCDVSIEDRSHFFALAAKMMRQTLVDHARGKLRAKRGAGAIVLSLDDVGTLADQKPSELLDLNSAIEELAKQDERKAQVVELHYFGGLTYEECATVLKVSDVTIHRDLKLARAWLKKHLSGESK